jgi:hypothetical protein
VTWAWGREANGKNDLNNVCKCEQMNNKRKRKELLNENKKSF